MRTAAPAVLPIFRSDLQARLLLHLLTSDHGDSASDLARATGAPVPTVHREVTRLAAAGLLRSEHRGRTILYRADEENPATVPLRQLVLISHGPVELLRQTLADVPGIIVAKVFGSWAARASGEPGPSPGDVDLLVVGPVDRRALFATLSDLEPRVGRPINPTVIGEDRWARSDDPLVDEIRSRPTIDIVGG
ncbi:MarR family transcriptional regulator [Cellulomonas pakistanensis]|uniref:MarR family transcriptional regulator n=1 Tax=Cellulomonas pakistanensis TaxID=992287 RepID=UPI00194065A0|nr:MarR family transcriptional regulator [Cellulomonas pakistanensis]